jgi:hypothetical protein
MDAVSWAVKNGDMDQVRQMIVSSSTLAVIGGSAVTIECRRVVGG